MADAVPTEEFLELAGGRVHLLRGGTGEPALFPPAAGRAGAWHPFHAQLAWTSPELCYGQAVVGLPAAVADRLAELYAKLGGFGQLIGLFAIGPSTHQQMMRSPGLFASDVMPALRPLGVAAERTTT